MSRAKFSLFILSAVTLVYAALPLFTLMPAWLAGLGIAGNALAGYIIYRDGFK